MSVIELSRRGHVARKQHRCFWCEKAIAVGTPYVGISQVVDGDFFYVREHRECSILAEVMFAEGESGELYSPMDFQDWIRERVSYD